MRQLNILLSSRTLRRLNEVLASSSSLKPVMAFEKIEALVLEAKPKDFDIILLDIEHYNEFHIEDLRELFPKLPVVLCYQSDDQLDAMSNKKIEKCNDTIMTDDLSSNALEQILNLIHSKHQSVLQQKNLKMKVSGLESLRRERDGNVVLHQNALLQLAKIKFKQEILDHSFENIGLIVLDTLGVERFSIWIMDSHLEQLKCECFVTGDGYQSGDDVPILLREDHADYFDQLENGELLALESEAVDSKIYDSSCYAVVETPLFEDGVVYGMVRLEELNEPRSWSIDELTFVDAVGDMVTMAVDQWELHRIEEDHRRRESDLKKKLQASNVELQEFSSIVSHDLQDPLYKIDAFGDLLSESCEKHEDEQAQFYIKRILNASERMRQLIQDLLEFSRVESQGRPFQKVDLNNVLKTTVMDLEVRIAETGAKIRRADLPEVNADITQMEQLFRNIVGNALKFTKTNQVPEIKIDYQFKLNKGVHIISFIDNGVGFDTGDEKKIFGVFQRLYSSEEYEGTGMGLAIVQKIIKRHGWQISAHGKAGEGTQFLIQIPFHTKSDSTES